MGQLANFQSGNDWNEREGFHALHTSESVEILLSEGEKPKNRLEFLDVFRGIGILATVEIHVCGALMSATSKQSPEWLFLFTATRALLFAVPAFLILTTLLQVNKLQRPFKLGDVMKKAVFGIAYPYLLWSMAYLFIAYKNHQIHTTPIQVLLNILFGKAYGSLYFLRILFQLMVLLPLFAPIFRKKPSGISIVTATVLSTLAFYALNRFALRINAIGSVIFWYIPGIGAGIWLGLKMKEIPENLKKAAHWAAPIAIVSFCFYLPLSIQAIKNLPVDTFHFQIAEWTYTVCASLLALLLAAALAKNASLSKGLQILGASSMQIYLLHPFLLNYAVRFLPSGRIIPFWLALLLYPLLIVPTCFGIAFICRKLKLSQILFGRVE